jgi:hypothetical protein
VKVDGVGWGRQGLGVRSQGAGGFLCLAELRKAVSPLRSATALQIGDLPDTALESASKEPVSASLDELSSAIVHSWKLIGEDIREHNDAKSDDDNGSGGVVLRD